MRIIAFIQDRPAIERILAHIGKAITPSLVAVGASAAPGGNGVRPGGRLGEWPEMDQTAGTGGDTWD